MLKVFKYPVRLNELKDVITITMPEGAEVLSAVNQYEQLAIYAMVDETKQITVDKNFRVVGTGHPISGTHTRFAWKFIGTVLFDEGHLVFHVWEIP